MKMISRTLLSFLVVILMLGMCITLRPDNVSADTLQGAGTEQDPFLITDEATLKLIHDFPDAYWKLTTNITLTEAWTPVPSGPEEGGFSGTFDGDGYAIDNVILEDTQNFRSNPTGFFRKNSGAIKNLTISGTMTQASSGISGGTMVYDNSGVIENCSVTANISLTNLNTHSRACPYVGGFVYSNSEAGIIRNCYARASISYGGQTDIHNPWYIAGFAAENRGTIENCYACGSTPKGSSTYEDANGKGFVGLTSSDVTNCFYDKDAAGSTDVTGGSFPRSATAMKMQATYVNWDFDSIWDIDEDANDGYPYLQTEKSVYKKVKGVTLNRTKATVAKGTTLQLNASVQPNGASNTNVTWSTSSRYVAAVEDGMVTAVSEGQATITVTTEEGGYEASCIITVTDGTMVEPENDYEYNILSDGTAEITGYTGGDTNLIIPYEIDGYSVTSIGYGAFANNTAINSITLTGNITHIGVAAFYGCSNLSDLTLSNNIISIEESAFYGCSSLENITLPNKLESLGSRAFYGCSNLESIIIPNAVTAIQEYTFDGCTSLSSVTLPKALQTIGYGAFHGCTGLTEILLPDSLTSIAAYAFLDCSSLKKINIPNQVTQIAEGAFANTSLTEITIPDNVISIGENAFYGCDGLIIDCTPGSAADTYAKNNGITVTPGNSGDTNNGNTTPDNSAKTTITLKKASASIYVKGQTSVNATITNGKGSTTYSSSKPKVAAVSSSGKITGMKKGTANITVTNNGVSKTFKITVKNPSLNKKNKTLKLKKKFTLKIKGQIGKATFKSSNKKVASVTKKGKITAKKKGKAVITVKTNGITLKCKITVKK